MKAIFFTRYLFMSLLAASLLLWVGCDKDDDEDSISYGSVKDTEGNTYKTVTIGSQTWMTQDLRTTKLNTGLAISEIQDSTQWSETSDPAFSWYNNDPSDGGSKYGALYNFYAVETGRLCPSGWKVPSRSDWNKLIDYLSDNGYNEKEGQALKATSGWHDKGNGKDPYGFKALPSGYRTQDGLFVYRGQQLYMWSSSKRYGSKSWCRSLYFVYDHSLENDAYRTNGMAVRCMKG